MRHGLYLASLLLLAGANAAMGQTLPKECQGRKAGELKAPCVKFIKITNNSKKEMLYPIIFSGARDEDNWLQSLFGLSAQQVTTDKFATKYTYRSYVIEDQGMAPGTTIYVQVPFYSQIAAKPDPTKKDQYADWWNGGRVFFYDDKKQIEADYTDPVQQLITPVTNGLQWCTALNAKATACLKPHPLKLFRAETGFPPYDRSQLTEYTFADAVTANGPPYPLFLNKVGYNISSVDQVYLPIAMEPLGNPTIPYIGTVVGLPEFRAKLEDFLVAFPGWPVYAPVKPGHPRIPGAYNVYAAKADLTPSGQTIADMNTLYRQCNTKTPPDKTALCSQYQDVVALLQKNYDAFAKLPCHDPAIKFDEAQIIKRAYGWVPFNEGCGAGANSLKDTVGSTKLAALEAGYIHNMQYAATLPLYNPFVMLIHSHDYLDMAAYAFSIDDAIGFQSYIGTGLNIAYAGPGGLDNTQKLDLADRVTVTLGTPPKSLPQWSAYGLCSAKANYGQFQNGFFALDFFPSKYPCRFTAQKTDGSLYQFEIKTAPASPSGLSVSCPANVSNPAWCAGVYVPAGENQQINAPDK